MAAVREYLEGTEGAVPFVELVKGLEIPAVAVLIGVLLGGFMIEQTGDFYRSDVLVRVCIN